MDLFAHWALIEADLHERYGIDLADVELMRRRTWRWLRARIDGLLSLPPVVTLAYGHPPLVMPATRIGFALNPPGKE